MKRNDRTERNGRKIDPDCENPIDNVLIQCADKVSDLLYLANSIVAINVVTPNMITTVSNTFSIFGVYYLYNGYAFPYFLCVWLGYFFDCLDGHFARKYDMCTVFGDYYDHVSDVIVHIALFASWYMKYSVLFFQLSITLRIICVTGLLLIGFMAAVHIASQEIHHSRIAVTNHRSNSMNVLKTFYLIDKKYLKYTRYFGAGTLMTTVYTIGFLSVMLLENIKDGT